MSEILAGIIIARPLKGYTINLVSVGESRFLMLGSSDSKYQMLRVNDQDSDDPRTCLEKMIQILALEDSGYDMGDILSDSERGALVKGRHSRTIAEVIRGLVDSPEFEGDFEDMFHVKSEAMKLYLE